MKVPSIYKYGTWWIFVITITTYNMTVDTTIYLCAKINIGTAHIQEKLADITSLECTIYFIDLASGYEKCICRIRLECSTYFMIGIACEY